MVPHRGKVFSSSRGPGEGEWTRRGKRHQHRRHKADTASLSDTCTAKLQIWMYRNGWGIRTRSPEKNLREAPTWNLRSISPPKGEKNKWRNSWKGKGKNPEAEANILQDECICSQSQTLHSSGKIRRVYNTFRRISPPACAKGIQPEVLQFFICCS